MKKLFAIIMIFTMILPIKVKAEDPEKVEVKLSNCVDSESARFISGVQEIKVKFIGIQLEEKIIDTKQMK